MTLPGTLTAATPAPQSERFVWRAEIADTVKLAWPMALTQLGQIAMMTTDLALIGRLGDAAVASVGLAHLILFVGFVFGMGLVSAVATLAAQAYGARKPRMVRRSLRMGLWAAVILGIPINVIQLWGEDILIAAGQTHETATLAARYLLGLAWSMIPAWCFIALRNFMGAVNRPEPALWITLAAIPVNALLAYALIHGYYGLPRLDLLGAGLATTFVNVSHVRRGGVDLLRIPPIQEISRAGPLLADGLGADAPTDRDRRADFRHDAARVGRCSQPPRFWWAGSAPPRLPRIRSRCRSRRSFHGSVRHLDGGHRAGRSCGRPRRSDCDAPRGLRCVGARSRHHGGPDPGRRRIPAPHSAALSRRCGREGRRNRAACRRRCS